MEADKKALRKGMSAKARFGTFAGVFTPNVLTILGLVLFLRMGWVLGQVGLVGALFIIMLANLISLLSGLSLSALASSMNVREGGYYYIISRSLGLEIGGAIGLPLFLSQAVSVAFYVIGFTEVLVSLKTFGELDPKIIASLMVTLFGLIAYIGADFALKIQYGILAVLTAALVSFFAGGWGEFVQPEIYLPDWTGQGFWFVFAVFFPAVTGIEVGASLSGDLRDPARSIPRGTLYSILVTWVIYLMVVFWLALHFSLEELRADELIMQRLSPWPVVIIAGVWASTLSSALGAVLAAPRTLRALGQDELIPKWMTANLGSKTEPRMAVLITYAVALGTVWMGELNLVANMVTMFFLNTYGMVNLTASIEEMAKNPSYRSRIDLHWAWSLLGALGCYGAMFLIHWPITLLAIVISYGIYLYYQKRSLQTTGSGILSGFWFSLARQSLLNIEGEKAEGANWRPNIVVFTGQPYNRPQLVQMADWLTQGQGIVSFFQLIKGDLDDPGSYDLQERAKHQIQEIIQKEGIEAFAGAQIVENFYQDALTLVQSHGVGRLTTNTVMLGWSGEEEGALKQMDFCAKLLALKKSVLILKANRPPGEPPAKSIDLWWRGGSSNASMMLLLAHMIRQHQDMEYARIRLFRVLEHEEGREQTLAHMKALLKAVRVKAIPIVLVDEQEMVMNRILAESRHSGLVLLGLHKPDGDNAKRIVEHVRPLMEGLDQVLLVRNAREEENILITS